MSEKDVELAHTFNDAFNRDGWQALWRMADPEIEFREPPEQPGASVFNGLDSARNGGTRSWDQLWSGQHSVFERAPAPARAAFLGRSGATGPPPHKRNATGEEMLTRAGQR
jgi:hypothetical protein